jgi:hypothetical protein
MQSAENIVTVFNNKYMKPFLFNDVILILLVINVILVLVFLGYFLYMIHLVHKKTEKILLLFLDIPRKNLLSIFKKCDLFLKFCSNFTLDKK